MFCKKCNSEKPDNEFKTKNGKQYWSCKSCRNLVYSIWAKKNKIRISNYQKNWVKNHPDHKKDENGKTKRKHLDTSTSCQMLENYGITLAKYEIMFARQNGCCFICGNPEITKTKEGQIRRLSIDHDHATGRVRKLLCDACNHGIGNFHDNIIVMERAIQYIKDHWV